MEVMAGTHPASVWLAHSQPAVYRRVLVWVAVLSIAYYATAVLGYARLMMPTLPGGNPFSDSDFEWKYVNYSPIVTVGTFLLLLIWWQVSAKKWFRGPISNIDPEVAQLLDD